MSQAGPQPSSDLAESLPESWHTELARRTSAAPGPVEERIAVIEDSLQCFTHGRLSCLPVIGVAWLYPAVRRFAQARRRQAEWNLARGYLAAGMLLASAGWLVGVMSWLLGFAASVRMVNPEGTGVALERLVPRLLALAMPASIFGLLAAAETIWAVRVFSTRFWQWVFGVGSAGVFGVLWWLLTKVAAEGRFGPFGPELPLLTLWATWLTAGFVTLALSQAGRWAWLVWFAALVGLSVPMLVL